MHSHKIHSLATVNYPTSPRRNSLPPPSHQNSGNIQRLFINNPKLFKDFFACKVVLAANHQYPGNIQRLFRLQICLSRKSPISREYSNTFRPAAATSNSNQQQQPATATSNSNQQQQPATAINSSNQQQQSTATIKSSNQQQQSTALTSSNNQHPSY